MPDARHRFDERVIGAGTTPRFVLLVILLLVSSGSMMITISFSGISRDTANRVGRALAAGADPNRIDDLASGIGAILHADALRTCVARYAPESAPDRLDLLWPALVLVVARAFILAVFLTALVYLARADVLRMREVYADLAAVRGSARVDGPGGCRIRKPGQARLGPLRRDVANPSPVGSQAGRAGGPRDAVRRAGAADVPDRHRRADDHHSGRDLARRRRRMASVSGVAAGGRCGHWRRGVALWRAAAHAVLTERRVPSGVRAGLWLGAGMVVGAVATNQVSFTR